MLGCCDGGGGRGRVGADVTVHEAPIATHIAGVGRGTTHGAGGGSKNTWLICGVEIRQGAAFTGVTAVLVVGRIGCEGVCTGRAMYSGSVGCVAGTILGRS